MARLITLAELRTEVQQRADLVDNVFISDAELNGYINQSIADLYDKLCNAYGDEYFEEEAVGQTVPNDPLLPLGGTVYKISDAGIWWLVGPTQFQRLEKYDPNDALIEPLTSTWWYGKPVMYRLQKDAIRFVPTPTGAHTIQLFFIPPSVRLTQDSETFDGYNGWEEWVVWDATIKCIHKEEGDPQLAMAERERISQRIDNSVTRDRARPARIQRNQYRRRWRYGQAFDPDIGMP